jgi:hypothetical protein
MDLFDVVKNMFSSDKKKWDSVLKIEKNRNFFMINRIMSIQYPIQSNLFNKTKITPNRVVDWWHGNLSRQYGKPPKWIFTTTKKEGKKTIKKDDSDFKEAESLICLKFNVSMRDLNQIKSFYPDKYSDWMKDVKDQMGLKK